MTHTVDELRAIASAAADLGDRHAAAQILACEEILKTDPDLAHRRAAEARLYELQAKKDRRAA